MSEEIELSARQQRLAARVWGPPRGRPVLALHGWLDNAASFEPLAPLLPGLRLVALDLPGHGRSGHRPAGLPYHFSDFVADVLGAADALGWERFALLGHSLGAGIASVAAAVAPERVERLALLEGIGPLSGNAQEAPRRLARSIAAMGRVDPARLPVYPDRDAAVAARVAAGGLSAAAAAVLCARALRAVPGGVTWRSDPRLRVQSPVYFTEEQVLAFLGGIRAPALLVITEAGFLAPREWTARRCARVAGLEVVRLAGGHHLHLEDPRAVAPVLRRFLAAGA